MENYGIFDYSNNTNFSITQILQQRLNIFDFYITKRQHLIQLRLVLSIQTKMD